MGKGSVEQSPPVLFLDRNLGKYIVADKLKESGEVVEVHDDSFDHDTPDHEWLRVCAERQWIVLCGDKLSNNELARQEIRHAGAKVFSLAGSNQQRKGSDKAEIIKQALPQVKSVAQRHRLYVFATIYADGSVKVVEGSN